MCGICGIVNFDKNCGVDERILTKMMDVITHRGPDDGGLYIKNNVGLGFRRLSIIDLSTGHQPIPNEDKTIWINHNGEIYNFKELKEDLLEKGHKFRTNSDSEVVLHLYEEYGSNCINMLRGMFGIIIFDQNKNEILIARDRLGIKPIYYYIDDKKLLYGSELKSITAHPEMINKLDYAALDSFFAFGYIAEDLSIYEKVKKLLPGHLLRMKVDVRNSIKIEKYWEPEFKPDYSLTEEDWLKVIDREIRDSVKRHMVSDVPLGAFLSGGIDSSAVVAYMATLSDKPIKTFTISFKEQSHNEGEQAKLVSKMYNTDHTEFLVEPESISLVDKLVESFDEPYADSSALPTYYVTKLAREHVTVALSGDGGDEFFAGYNSYFYYNKLRNMNKMPDWMSKTVGEGLMKVYPDSQKGYNTLYRMTKGRDVAFAYNCAYDINARNKFYKDKKLKNALKNPAEQYRATKMKNMNYADYVNKMQHLDISSYMVDDILTKVDRMSMLNSLEVRVPLLDNEFIEMAMRIPAKYTFKNGEKKYLLKKAVEPMLPPEIMNKKKRGFAIPLKSWFNNELNEYLKDTFTSKTNPVYDFLSYNYVQKILGDKGSSLSNATMRIWMLVMFNKWLEQNRYSI